MTVIAPLAATRPEPRRSAERLILPATLITCLGNNVQLTAAALLVAANNNTAMAIAWVFIATAVPQALFSVPFGRLADRVDRRTLCLICDLACAALAVALPIWLALGGPTTTAVYLTTLVLSIVNALFTAASNAVIKERIADERVAGFSAGFDMATSAGNLLSTAIGGIAIQAFGPQPLFWFNGVTFAASAALWFLLGRNKTAPGNTEDAVAAPSAGTPTILRLGMLYALGNIIITVSNVLIVVLVISMFRQGPGVLGVVDGLAGTGMLTAGLVYKRLIRRYGDLSIALAGFMALGVIFILQPNIGPAGMLLFLPGGMFFGLARIAARTMLMTAVDPRRAGRVFGAVNASSLVFSIAATLAVSAISDHTHVRFGFLTMTVIIVAIAPLTVWSLRRVMADTPPREAAPH